MPISLDEYREPKWIRHRKRYTIAGHTDAKSRFMKFEQYPRNYRGGIYPQAGYNPNNQAIRVEKINLERDDYTLKPR